MRDTIGGLRARAAVRVAIAAQDDELGQPAARDRNLAVAADLERQAERMERGNAPR